MNHVKEAHRYDPTDALHERLLFLLEAILERHRVQPPLKLRELEFLTELMLDYVDETILSPCVFGRTAGRRT